MARGFTPDSGASWLLPRLIGVARARKLLLLGEQLTGARAAEWGMIHGAVRDDEVSLDMPDKGGVATQAWRDCIAGSAVDRDASGGLSAAEIQACAQAQIDARLKGVKGFLPHHVTVAGNAGAVLSFPEGAATGKPSAYNTLLDIYNSRDDRRVVRLEAARSAFRIGQDEVEFSLTSSHAGYAYLLMVGSDGASFDTRIQIEMVPDPDEPGLWQVIKQIEIPRT